MAHLIQDKLTFAAAPVVAYPGGPIRANSYVLVRSRTGSSGSTRPSPLQRRVGTTSHLSRPARTSHALRPARLLAHLSVDFYREVSVRPVSRPNRSLAIESNHPLFEWVLPPLVICPF